MGQLREELDLDLDALEGEGLLELVEARQDAIPAALLPLGDGVCQPPILLAVSDNGPQMTSGTTREFMAMCAITQHFGRPGTPTDQAWIESLFGHVKAEWPKNARSTASTASTITTLNGTTTAARAQTQRRSTPPRPHRTHLGPRNIDRCPGARGLEERKHGS